MQSVRHPLAATFVFCLAVLPSLRGEPDARSTETPPVPPTPAAVAAPPKADPAVAKFWKAVDLFGSGRPADLAAGRAALQESSDLEYTHAQMLLANCLLGGSYGFPVDARKAVNLLRLAAEHGNAFAKLSYGHCLFAGVGTRKDFEKAQLWLTAVLAPDADFSRPVPPPEQLAKEKKAAGPADPGVAGALEHDPVNQMRAEAHYLLGVLAVQQKKSADAHLHFVAAATVGPDGRDGNCDAAYTAALDYAFGTGTPRDLEQANRMLDHARRLGSRLGAGMIHNYVALKMVDDFATADLEETADKASEQVETELQFNIASSFANKNSKDYNPAEAAKWYELAAERGRTWAMLSLAFLYLDGSLGAPQPAKAFTWFEKAGGGDKPKHLLAAANLAICYQNGYGTARDPVKAAAIFQRQRDEHFLCYLGSIGQAPAVPQTYEQAMALLVAAKKDPHAQYFLGLRYLGGWDVPRDLDKAVSWLDKSALGGVGAAYNQLGLIASYAPTIAHRYAEIEYYRRGGNLGNPDALLNLADFYDSGEHGLPRDEEQAEALYLHCLQLAPDQERAHNNLAVMYERRLRAAVEAGDTAKADKYRRLALEHYEAACERKEPHAARNLGLLYYHGNLVPQDYRRAYEYFEQASELGLTGVHFTLGQMHELGQGLPVTLTEAAYHYRLAALEQDREALQRLIGFYVEGKGVSQDFDRALYWIAALEHGFGLAAVTDLGDHFIREKKYAFAQRLYEILAHSTNVPARGFANQRLSLFYSHGLGVPKDPALAREFQKKAVADGNLSALEEYGAVLYAEGKKTEALGLWEQAAKHGYPATEARLGTMYARGDGVRQDLKRAFRLLGDAAQKGDASAQITLATLTLENVAGAPDLDTAIQLAAEAAKNGEPRARELQAKLQQRRKI